MVGYNERTPKRSPKSNESQVTRMPNANYSEFIQLLRYQACETPESTDCQFYRRRYVAVVSQ